MDDGRRYNGRLETGCATGGAGRGKGRARGRYFYGRGPTGDFLFRSRGKLSDGLFLLSS